jgi:hypothetical protein
VNALKAKAAALAHDGVVVPLQGALADLNGLLGELDVGFVRTDLQAVHDQIAADIDAFRPSNVLAPIVASVEATQHTIAAFDPLGAVREAVEAMKAAVEEVGNDFRPTTIFAPILDSYEHVLAAAEGLDVRNLLKPILDALDEVKQQLDQGLDEAADALDHLQAALP